MARAIRHRMGRALPTPTLLLVSAVLLGGFAGYLYEGYPSPELGPAPLGIGLDLLIPAIAGYVWGRRRPVGLRWYAEVVLPLLLLSAVVPISLDMPYETAFLLFARALLLIKWAMATCGAAGLTVTWGLLGERWRKRAAG